MSKLSLASVPGCTLKKTFILKILFSGSLTLYNISISCAQEEASFFWWNCVHCREGCTRQKLQLNSNSLTLESIAMNDYALALCIRNLKYRRPESCFCSVRNFKAHSSLQRPPLSFMRKAKKL